MHHGPVPRFALALAVVLVACCGCGKAPARAHRHVYREKWGYMDKTGRMAIGAQFDEVTPFHEGLAAVRVGKKWGFIDTRGRFAIKPAFLAPSRFSEGIACVSIRWTSHDTEYDHSGDWDEMTCIDRTGKHLFSLRAVCRDFSHGLAAFGTGFDSMDGQPNKWNYINTSGNAVIKHDFASAGSFSEGLALVEINGPEIGYIDASGRLVICAPFDSGSDFHEGLAAVRINGKAGYIDKSGQVVVKPRFDLGGDFHCGRARVLCGDSYGYIDRKGLMIVRPTLSEAEDFSEGMAKFRDTRNLKYGYVGLDGKVSVPARYDDALGFHEGLALVRIGKKTGYIDTKGNTLIVRVPSTHDYMAYDETTEEQWSFSEGLAPVLADSPPSEAEIEAAIQRARRGRAVRAAGTCD